VWEIHVRPLSDHLNGTGNRTHSGEPSATANDEVERRGSALSQNEADLCKSSTPSLASPKMQPRDRSNRLLGVACEYVSTDIYYFV
jgi:hypothetical protein